MKESERGVEIEKGWRRVKGVGGDKEKGWGTEKGGDKEKG